MINMLRRTGAIFTAFVVRDYLRDVSYRLAFVLSFSGIFVSTFGFFFVSRLIDPDAALLPAQYEGNYFAFVLTGIAFSSYFGVGLRSFAEALRMAQVKGTLEAMLISPTPLSMIVIGSALWSYLLTSFRVVLYLLLGWILGVRFDAPNLLAGAVALLLAIVAFAAVGIASASFIMVTKRGDPFTFFFGLTANLFGGVFFPIEALPGYLQWIGRLLPITYALNAIRDALLFGASWRAIAPDLLVLGMFALLLLPLTLYGFRRAVQRARLDGSLAHY